MHARAGRCCYDTMTLVGPGTWQAARAAVDAALTAVDLVVGGAAAAYALCRPPGHHATRSAFGGSCYLNNAAVAAQALRAAGHDRVAVVDIDAHHGNGTQAIFYDRADVLYASMHVDPGAGWFPHYVGLRRRDRHRRRGSARTSTCRSPRAPATRSGSTASTGWRRRSRRTGAPRWSSRSASTPQPTTPESPLQVTTAGVRRRRRACWRRWACRRSSSRRAAITWRPSAISSWPRWPVRDLSRGYPWQVGSPRLRQSPSSLSRRSPQQHHKQPGAARLVSSPEPASGSVSVAEFGPNQWLVDELYQAYLADKKSVDPAWWDFFADYQPVDVTLPAAEPAPTATPTARRPRPTARRDSGSAAAATPPAARSAAVNAVTAGAAPVRCDPRSDAPRPRLRPRPAARGRAAGRRARRTGTAEAQPGDHPPRHRRQPESHVLRGPAARVVANMEASLDGPDRHVGARRPGQAARSTTAS